jgi:hypothetical protein
VLRGWFGAWNRADWDAMLQALHVPHIGLAGPRLEIREATDMTRGIDFRGLRSLEGWHRTIVDGFEDDQRSDDKVHHAVTFGREAGDGRRYADGQAVYVVTQRNGRWGIQLSSATLIPLGTRDTDDAAAVAAATRLLERWVDALDAPAPLDIRQLVHLPFVEVDGTRLVLHRTEAELRRARPAAAARSRGQRSALRRLTVRERSARKVSLEYEAAHFDRVGGVVGHTVALAIILEREGEWGLQAISTF